MPDNYKIDKQFEDKGWDNMRSILDKDLPVHEEKKRRWVPFFWMLLAGMLIGVGITKWMESTPVENNIPVIETTKEMAENTSHSRITAPIVTENSLKDNSKVNNSTNLETITDTETKRTLKDDRTTESNHISQIENTSNSKTINKSNTSNISQSITTIANLPSTENLNNLSNNNISSTLKNISSDSFIEVNKADAIDLESNQERKYWNTTSISSLKLQALDNNSVIYDIFLADKLKGKMISIASPRLWSYMLHSGIGANLTDRYHINFGGIIARDLGKKWALESGLLLDFEKRNSTVLSFSAAADSALIEGNIENENEPSTGNWPNQTSADLFYNTTGLEIVSVYNQVVTNSYRLKIPLNAIYKVNPKLHLVGGIYGQYTLSTRSSSTSDLAFDNQTNDFNNRGNKESFSSIINKFNLGLHTGLRYWPNPKLGLELSYNQNIQPEISPNFFKSENALDASQKAEYRNGSLNIGVRFKFY